MGRFLLILGFAFPALCMGQGQSMTVDDLLDVASLSPQHFDNYIIRKGFSVKRRSIIDNTMGFAFFRSKVPVNDSLRVTRSINVYKKNDTWCIALHTSSIDEYMDMRGRLKKMKFKFDPASDTAISAPLLFQKSAITVQTEIARKDDGPDYTVLVTKKEIPNASSIRFGDDLLRFDSHEYLASCFGENNVKKDIYVCSDKESKKCSILYPNTDKQAVFIWEDEGNYRKISYILISGTIPTPGVKEFNGSFSHNKWELKNGIYQGMRLSDLLRLNSNDFKFYGNQSEYSMMVEPRVTGSINFKWIGIGFNCFNCDRAAVLEKQKVSASDAVNNNLAMHISCIMISP